MKRVLSYLSIALLSLGLGCSSIAAEGGVNVSADDASPTGYTATFRYENEEADRVELKGSFGFYEDGDERFYAGGYNLEEGEDMNAYILSPEEWTKEGNLVHIGDESYVTEMTKGEDGVWEVSLHLPGGYYLYQYNVYAEGIEEPEAVTDPCNSWEHNDLGGVQARSQFYVPYDAEKMGEYYDWSWCLPAEKEEDRGTLSSFTYVGFEGVERNALIYLPAHYDPEREEPYKTLYLSHGGWGNEGDWFFQGHAGNIMDRLAAAGECEECVLVTMNNDEFPSGGWWVEWDADKYIPNIMEGLIPYVEEHYHVSKESKDKAFAGLSSGAVVTGNLLHYDPTAFGHFGMFSCSATYSFPEKDDYADFLGTDIVLAGGFADYCVANKENEYTDEDVMVTTYAEKLEEKEIPYNQGNDILLVPGNHDWFTWPQILKEYLTTYLW
ncbi:MAG: hypothetical protein IIZ39_10755 [Blautia sp.]|nr:hypothetical protein [Blautia sp.]